MSIRDKLPKFLDDIDGAEIDSISFMVLAEKVRDLKVEVARAIANAEACELIENQEGVDRWMKLARDTTKGYKHFLSQYNETKNVVVAPINGAHNAQ